MNGNCGLYSYLGHWGMIHSYLICMHKVRTSAGVCTYSGAELKAWGKEGAEKGKK